MSKLLVTHHAIEEYGREQFQRGLMIGIREIEVMEAWLANNKKYERQRLWIQKRKEEIKSMYCKE